MNNKTREFLEIVKQNSDLPIYPMVESEVCCSDEFSYWHGAWGHCEVSEYCLFYIHDEEHFFTRESQDEIEEYIANELSDFEEYSKLSDQDFDKIVHEKAEILNWKKAIIVYITLPEEIEE